MKNRFWAIGSSLAVVATLTGAWLGQSPPPLPRVARPVPADLPFLWGVATAGFQSEGGDKHSNWAYWHPEDATLEPAGKAVDFWHRYDEDMALASGLGVNAFRLSVEWSRLEPTPGRWDKQAIAQYKRMFESLRRRHLQPVITLSHWTMPAWVDAQGGWTDPEVPKRYARFVEKVVTEIAPDCRLWLTFNEPNVWLFRDYVLGVFPPNRTSLSAFRSARSNVFAGHALAYDVIHRHAPQAMVSANMYHVRLAKRGSLARPLGADVWDNYWYVDQFRQALAPGEVLAPANGRLDYLSYDYYYAFRTVDDIANIKDPWLLPVDPDGLEEVILDYDRRYGLPQLIAENGMATEDGKTRADGWTPEAALRATVKALGRARDKGAPLLGYCYWTLTDNYEWGSFVPRFGLFAIDARKDPLLKRVPTATAEAYRQIISADRLSRSGMTAVQAPAAPEGAPETPSAPIRDRIKTEGDGVRGSGMTPSPNPSR